MGGFLFKNTCLLCFYNYICNKYITFNMDKFKKQIESKGLKITWIAKKVGISQPLLSMYLSGDRNMPKEIEQKVKEILK